ncbi:MAG TPA: pitrilysin family protein [Catalimonadaceae bacterium]|nr:pitrilysin family protein [Catalimonadaceae bacterium]
MKIERQLFDYQIHQFPNGIRLVHKQVPGTRVSHCGFILDVGSRDELPHQQGIAHFWEHMAFKGTGKRKAFHILNRLEILGGEINAYTTKEKIAFHASVLASHFPKAVDILTDITFFSTFPQKEILKEKNVILEEMAMYQDTPDDAIQDEFDLLLYPGHPLGNNILGTEESVASFERQDFVNFFQENVSTDRLIFSSVGPFDLKTAVRKAGPFLEKAPNLQSGKPRLAPPPLIPENRILRKPSQQAHLMLGCRAYALSDEKRLAFFMLNNILGGPALNSRLNMSIREKHGLVYSVESSYAPYLDTGAFSVYLGTEAKNLNKALALAEKEIQSLQTLKLSPTRLLHAREQLKGQLAMAEEGNQMLMLMLGKSILDQGRVESLAEIFKAIDAVSAEKLQDVANESWGHSDWVRLTYLPEKQK